MNRISPTDLSFLLLERANRAASEVFGPAGAPQDMISVHVSELDALDHLLSEITNSAYDRCRAPQPLDTGAMETIINASKEALAL